MKLRSLFWLLSLSLCAPRFLCAQATVNETLETAFVYVDGVKGSDSNPGTQAQPLKTIGAGASKATANNHKGLGTRVLIAPATYPESISLYGTSSDTSLPITLQASGSGVVVSGAVHYAGWQSYSGNPAIYSDPWSHTWGQCPASSGGTLPGPFEQEIVLRREMIFVNGTAITQVLGLGQMQQGTFFVDEPAHLVYLWPPSGTDMATADVEVATLPQLMQIYNKTNIVVRGITFQHSNACRNGQAVWVGGVSKDILFDSDSFRWNNAVGLHIFRPASHFTVQSSSANNNGQSGMMSVNTRFALWQSLVTSFNNWRGAQGADYNWNSGGMHFFADHVHTISGLVTTYNQTHGIHWDTDNADITVSNMLAAQNLSIGALVEANEGPVAISNSRFCSNNLGVKENYQFQAGLVLRNSELVSLTGSTLYNNQISQTMVLGQKGGIPVTNWETGATYNLRTQGFVHTGNTIEAVGSSQQVFTDGYLGGTDWTVFQTTVNSNHNQWWNSSNTNSFIIPMGQVHPLSGWQSATAQDGLSNWSAPSDLGPTCAASSAKDYWMLVDAPSQTISPAGKAVFNVNLIPFGGLTAPATLHVDGIKQVFGLSGSLSSATVALSGSASLTVNAAAGAPAGTYPVTIIASSGGLTRTVTASLVVPATSVRLSTANLTFAAQQVQTSSPEQIFTMTNVGKNSLSLYGLSATSVDYSETNTCGSALAAGATCTVKVTFTPKSAGTRNASIQIKDGAADSPQYVYLSGVGTPAPAVSFSPTWLGFGSVTVGTTSAAKTVTLTNKGNGTLNIAGVSFMGTNPGDFHQTNTCGSRVAAGARCTFSFTFHPTAKATRKALLSLTDNAPGSPQNFNVGGVGQ
jgi:hypothetical protein